MPGRMMRAAATASMVSSARTNRAARHQMENQQASQAQAAQQPAASASASDQSDLAAQLEELNGLLAKGILTQAEFDAKKKQLLGI